MPATRPTNRAAPGDTSAAHALEATRPAIHPFAQRLASGLPKRTCVTLKVATSAIEPHRIVLMAVFGKADGAAFSHRIAPARLNASSPTRLIRLPNST